MSFWTDIRDAFQAVAVVAGNFFLPGSSAITSQLVSQGAQEHLDTPLGQLAQLGSGAYGGGSGNLGNWGKLYDAGSSALGFGSAGSAAAIGSEMGPMQSMLSSVGRFPAPGSVGAMGGGSAAGAGGWGSLVTPQNVMSALSGMQGLQRSRQMRGLAGQLGAQADPWGAMGGRQVAGGQLLNLLNDPAQLTQLPGYRAGEQAVMRSMASQGYQNSGNMMAALQKYGGDFYDKALTQLGGLAGAGQNPAAGATATMTGVNAANQLESAGLGSIGYAAGGNPNQAALLGLLRRAGAM